MAGGLDLFACAKRFAVLATLLGGDPCARRVALSLSREEGLERRREFSQGGGTALRGPHSFHLRNPLTR